MKALLLYTINYPLPV